VARRTGSDIRMLRCAVRACRRLPSLHKAISDRHISWSQARAVALKVDRVPLLDDAALDAAVADAIGACESAEPDALARMVAWAIDELRRTQQPEDRPDTLTREGFLHLQPRLDGTGGTAYGDLDALSFSILDAVTAPTGPPDTAATRDRFAGPTDPDRARDAARITGRQRLDNLLRRLGAPDRVAATADAAKPATTDGDGDVQPLPPVHLLLRAELDTLLGDSGPAAQLLTTLAGGAMHVDASTAKKLTERGCSLRLIVTDHGQVVGVGRRTKAPPGWLRDAALALHDTCTAPGCDRPARTAQLDHAIPWTAGGHTDIANCGPLCGHDNHHKETSGWRARGRPDGTRHWHHPRTGLHTTTYPATKRPPRPPRPPREPPGDPPDDEPS
jgi:hypothetical protein